MDVHGVAVTVESAGGEIFRWLEMDYGQFIVSGRPRPSDVTVAVVPPAAGLPGCQRGFDGSRVVVTTGRVLVAPATDDARVAYYDQVRPYLTASISRRLLAAEGTVMFHAAAVSVAGTAGQDAATIFVGEAGAGKTTMGLSAVAAGARYMANDLVFVRREAGLARVLAMPQPPMLGPGTQRSLTRWFHGWDGNLVPPARGSSPADVPQYGRQKEMLDPSSLPAGPLSAPLARVVFPLPDFGLTEPVTEPVTADESAFRLLPQIILPVKPGLAPELPRSQVMDVMRANVEHVVSHSEAVGLRWCENAGANIALIGRLVGAS